MRGGLLPSLDLLIVGTPRSGTTLLQRLAVESCGLRSAPETHFFSVFPRLLSQGPPVSRQRSREHLLRALEAYGQSRLLKGADLRPDAVLAQLEGRLVDVYDIFEGVVAALSGGPDRLCEKTPGHLWWWDHIAAARPTTRLAMIVRDPRAVVASMAETRFDDQSLAGYVEWWRHDQHLVEVARRRLGSRCLVLRYEDVVAAEDRARRALQALCAADRAHPPPGEPSWVGGQALALPWETWKAGYDGPVTTDRVESWRTRLTSDEAAFIERATAREMSAWGYVAGAAGTARAQDVSKRAERLIRRARIWAYRQRQPRLLAQTVDLR